MILERLARGRSTPRGPRFRLSLDADRFELPTRRAGLAAGRLAKIEEWEPRFDSLRLPPVD
jgi:hypothetical protein